MIHLDVVMPRLFAEGAGELRVQLDLASDSLTALVGPSGSGKTTLLRLLAGLETPRQGKIRVDGVVWLDREQGINRLPQQRSVGYVFQDASLFPNMTVRENIQYAAPAGEQKLVDQLIDQTGLEAFAGQKPTRLSGGQRQRVALARALVRRPQLLLLDEPFAALDAKASQTLRQVVSELHQSWGTTTLLVSHHEADVRALADRVIQLVQGRIDTDNPGSKLEVGGPLQERIVSITYNEAEQQWEVETTTGHIQSTNPAWSQLRVGDVLTISGT